MRGLVYKSGEVLAVALLQRRYGLEHCYKYNNYYDYYTSRAATLRT